MSDEPKIPPPHPCDMTILRETDNSLRHCTLPAEHVHRPIPAQRKHSDGTREWE